MSAPRAASRASIARLAGIVAALALAATPPAHAINLPPDWVVENYTPGTFDVPTCIAFLPDGRLLVGEKGGIVYVVKNGVRKPLWVREDEVLNSGDRGLLGLAVDPNYATNRYIYLLYTVDPDSNGYELDHPDGTFARLARYQVSASDSNVVDYASRTILIGASWTSGFPDGSESHTIGDLQWGADGSLLVSCGDGAQFDFTDAGGYSVPLFGPGKTDPYEDIGAFRAQYLGSLAGKILRVNRSTGHGLPSNPFWDGNPASNRSRVWEYGLRNPFRFCRKPGTGSPDPALGDPGRLYIGDVGWMTWEEVDVADQGGRNFGWPCYEGFADNLPYQGATPAHHGCGTIGTSENPSPARMPIVTTNHTDSSGTVPPGLIGWTLVGGWFYPGHRYPPDYRGQYFFGDYGYDWIKVLVTDAADQLVEVKSLATAAGGPVCFRADPLTGDIVYVAIYTGEILRIRYTGTLAVEPTLPASISLSAAYPNPAASRVAMTLDLPSAARVELEVFDLLGREVWRDALHELPAGRWNLGWSGESATGRARPGLYLARVRVNGAAMTRRFALLE